jgi:hypothetical protein
LETPTGIAAKTHKGRTLIKVLAKAINTILMPPAVSEQRVDDNIHEVETQREHEDIAPITRISDAPAIMKARDPTAKRNLIKDARTHRWITRNNTPGALPTIQRVSPALILPDTSQAPSATRKSNRVKTTTSPVIIIPPYRMLGGGTQANARLISWQALNAMTMREAHTPPLAFTPRTFVPVAYEKNVPNFAHFASPMINPTTGETISSYKRLMNDPETAKIWQKAFGTQRDDNARSTYTPIGFHPTNIRPHSIQKQCPKFCALCVADDTSDHGRNHIKLQTVDE